MGPLLDPTPRPTEASILGGALGQGIARNFPQPEQMVQKGLLQQAFDKLDPSLSYEEQLAAIVPTLMTTQGGAEALQTIAPILQQRAKNRAISEAIKDEQNITQQQDRPSQPKTGGGIPVQPSSQVGVSEGEITPQEAEDKFRVPSPPGSEEPIYPQMSAGPQKKPLLSPDEMKNYALGLMQVSDKTGAPMSFQEGMQLAQQEQQNRENFNQRIGQEQETRLQYIKDLNADVVERAVNSGLIQNADDEARTVAERLGFEARDAETPAARWEFVRTGLRKYNNAREGIQRESKIPGPFTVLGRKIIGTYKDKETVQKDLKPFVDTYKEYGLYDELRNELTTSLGMGPEDAEVTIFPLTSEEKNSIGRFSTNTTKPIFKRYEPYPGEGFNLNNQEKFDKFKNNLSDYLKKFPKANLVTLRGRLNQDKRYSWNDISRAIGELQEENRFVPDNYQYSQLPIINKAPLPGLSEQFKEWWKFTK